MNRGQRKGFYEDASNLSDEEFIKLLEEAYQENAELDDKMAEDFTCLSWESDKIYIIPKQDKPIKIIFEELPCPKDSEIRCEYAKSNSEDMVYSIICTNKNCNWFK